MTQFDDRDILLKIIDQIFEEIELSQEYNGASYADYNRGLNDASKIIAKYRDLYWNKNILNQ